MPQLWLSRGEFASLDDGATAKPFEEIAAKLLKGGQTVTFDLDDVLLVDDEGLPIKIDKAIPVSVFGREFVVKAPLPDEEQSQYSDISITQALNRGRDLYHLGTTAADGTAQPHAVTRVIRRGRKLYGLNGSRTTVGKAIGVRAAIREAHPIVRRPKSSLNGTNNRSQADYHLFTSVGLVKLETTTKQVPVDVVLVVATTRIRALPTVKLDDDDTKVTRLALSLAASSWTSEPLTSQFTGTSPTRREMFVTTQSRLRAVKFVFHFPPIDEGKSHITLSIAEKRAPEKFRAHALGRSIVQHIRDDFGDAAAILGLPPTFGATSHVTVAEDLTSYDSSVTAHEIGHTIGLPDEYAEHIAREIDAPRFLQGAHRHHLAYHGSSMMAANAAPLLRHLLVFATHVESISSVAGAPDRVMYCDTRKSGTGADAREHLLRLPAAHPSPYEVSKESTLGRGLADSAAVRVTFLGDDFDGSALAVRCTAVLEVTPKIYVRRRNIAFAGLPTIDQRNETLARLHEAIEDAFNGNHTLQLVSGTGLASTDAQRVLVRIAPRYSFLNPAAADCRLHIHQDIDSPVSIKGNRILAPFWIGGIAVVRAALGLPNAFDNPTITVNTPAVPSGPTSRQIRIRMGKDVVALSESNTRIAGGRNFEVVAGSSGADAGPTAASLAAAVNDASNGLADRFTAIAAGNVVELSPAQAGMIVEFTGDATGYDFHSGEPRGIEVAELGFIEDLATKLLGAEYNLTT